MLINMNEIKLALPFRLLKIFFKEGIIVEGQAFLPVRRSTATFPVSLFSGKGKETEEE